MKKLVLSSAAQKDLKSIHNYTLENWGKRKAIEYLDHINKTFVLIAENPLMGIERDDIGQDARSMTAKKHTIYYLLDKENINILGILRHSMLPSNHIKI